MTVIVSVTDRHGDTYIRDALCEPHARERTARLGVRWPEPWEPASVAWDPARRERIAVRILRGEERPCVVCTEAAEDAEHPEAAPCR